MAQTSTGRAGATIVGGLLLTGALALDDVAPDLVGIAIIVPVLLGFGLIEIFNRYDGYYRSLGRAGVVLTGVGLAFLFLSVLLYAVIQSAFFALYIVAITGFTAIATLAFGSAFLAHVLRRLDVIGAPTAVLIGAGVPLAVILTPLLTFAVHPGSPISTLAAGLPGTPYGVGWMIVGYRLIRTEDTDETVANREGSQQGGVSPNVATSALVGGTFLLLSVGRFVPLGPLIGTPWVNQSLLLDVGHLLGGTIGILLAVRGDVQLSRTYNRVIGLLSLTVVLLTILVTVGDPLSLGPLLLGSLELNLPDILLHLPAGTVFVVIGFGVENDLPRS